MPLATTKRTGLVDQVIAQMRELVASGEWPVGERIPPESVLVNELGVGRNTAREAVRALAHAGLFEVRQGDGTFVRATSELSGAVRRMYLSELRQVLEVRRALEVEGARLAATQRTEQDLAVLTETLRARDAAVDHQAWDEVVTHDTEFHLRLVEASHNSVLTELYRGLTEAVRSSVATTIDDHGLAGGHISHTELLEAVRDGQAHRAATEAGTFLEELLSQIGQTP